MKLEYPRYSDDLLGQLFVNILDDDVINLDAECPASFRITFQKNLVLDCYRLCWQSLDRNVDIPGFRKLILEILINGDTENALQREIFKYNRARFKHLRFAFANLDVRHSYPWSLNFITSLMGYMQDGFKNHQIVRTRFAGGLLWVALSRPFYTLIRYRMKQFRPTCQKSLEEYFLRENKKIIYALNQSTITAHEFHDIRKIISRRVAFNDTLRVLYPNYNADAISRYLATINGLMGNMHDTLIEKHLKGLQDYRHEKFGINDIIKDRLKNFVRHI